MANRIGLKEACKILQLSPNTVKKLVREGLLPAYQVAGVRGLQFEREDVEKLITPVEPTVTQGKRKR